MLTQTNFSSNGLHDYVFQVFLSHQCLVTGKPVPLEPKIDRESRQLLFLYRFPMPGHPVHFYDDGGRNSPYGNLNQYHQENIEEQKLLVNSLSSQAVLRMRNLNQVEQENLIAWTLASAAVASLTQERNMGSVHINPTLFSRVSSPSNNFFYGM